MSKSTEALRGERAALNCFLQAISHAQTTEQVFADGLNAFHDIFSPHRAFVVMHETALARPEQSTSPNAGTVSALSVPVYADERLVGKFILQFDEPRALSVEDVGIAELIATQCGIVIGALEKSQTRAELAAMAVHELRAPLTAIMGGALLIRSGKAVLRAVEIIERNVRLQEKLIDDLLSIAQIDAKRIDVCMSKIDLRPLLEELVDEAQTIAGSDGTRLELEAKGPLIVSADALRLRQVFSNLLENSVRCSPGGHVSVHGSVENQFVVVTVEDNGIGIAADELPYVFDRFRQIRSAGSRPNRGSGLGLAIVKDLIALHGGSVEAGSAGPGKGATFRVQLAAAIPSQFGSLD